MSLLTRWLRDTLRMTGTRRKPYGIASWQSDIHRGLGGPPVRRSKTKGAPRVQPVRIWLAVNHPSIWEEFHGPRGTLCPANSWAVLLGRPMLWRHMWQVARG